MVDGREHDDVDDRFARQVQPYVFGGHQTSASLTVPEMDWIVEVIDAYLDEVRPRFSPGKHPALWVTERCGRVSLRSANVAFEAARDAAGLDSVLDMHSLRHSSITRLTEFGYPERFVQDQVGHAHASTTAIYTHVSDEYRNRLGRKALMDRDARLWEEQA